MLPKEIIELWEEYGFGEYGDGLLKVVDPREYMNSLYTWLGQKDFNKIPIIVTAFGDIFYYRIRSPNNRRTVKKAEQETPSISSILYELISFGYM